MNLIDIKKNIETFFISNYNITEIHWAGMKFDTTSRAEWVYFEYIGTSIMDCGLDNSINNHSGYITVSVVADTPFRVNEIASSIIDIFKSKNIEGSIVRNANIIEQSYDSELDKSYMVLNLDVSSS